jgi:hypothetical protein
LTLLHDHQGHPLLATTHRGDLHLTTGIPSLLTRYEQATEALHLTHLVVDREAMSAGFLAQLKAQERTLTTILKRESVCWTRLVQQRRSVRSPHGGSTGHCPWWADIRQEEVAWWQEGWQATPAPASPTEPKLIPIVTTAEQIDALALARTYIHRWSAQENVIKDWLLPLGLDINHGFAKMPVVNSEVSKKREAWEKRLANVQRWGEAARVKAHRASTLSTKLWKRALGAQRTIVSRAKFADLGTGSSRDEFLSIANGK